jgi:hypothetical protein
MAGRTGRGGTVRGGKKAKAVRKPEELAYEILTDAGYSEEAILAMSPEDRVALAERVRQEQSPEVAAQPAAAGGGAAESEVGALFDQLASTHNDFKELMGGATPDLSGAIGQLVKSGISPEVIGAEMGRRGVDVSQFLDGIETPAAPTPEAPPTNMAEGAAGPVTSADGSLPAVPAGGKYNNRRPLTPAEYGGDGETYSASTAQADEADLAAFRATASQALQDEQLMLDAGFTEQDIIDMPEDEYRQQVANLRQQSAPPPASTAEATAPAPATAPMAATEAFPSPRILAELEQLGYDPRTMSPEDMQSTYESLVEQGYIDPSYRVTPGPSGEMPDGVPADSPVVAGADEGAQVAAALRTPIMDAIVRASDPNAMPGAMPAPDPLQFLSGRTSLEDAYRLLSDAGIPDSVLSRMDDAQMVRMAEQARSPQAIAPTSGLTADATQPVATSPQQGILGGLRDQQVAAAERAVGDALFPPQYRQAAAESAVGDALFPPQYRQGPPVEAAATSPPQSPTAGLTDTATATPPPPPEAGPLEMPVAPNPYGPDIYTQLQMATMGGGGPVQTRFSPEVSAAAVDRTPAMEMPAGWSDIANDPNVQLSTGEMDPLPPAPQVMDVGAGIPGGVGAAGANVRWRDKDGTLNEGPPRQPGRFRSQVIDTLLGTRGDDGKGRLGLINPRTIKMFSEDGEGFGMLGKATRMATSPGALRTGAAIALLKYISQTGGIKGWGTAAKPIGQAIWDGTTPQEEPQDGDNVDYATNYKAALDRLSRPMSGRGSLAAPMVPNSDRPNR